MGACPNTPCALCPPRCPAAPHGDQQRTHTMFLSPLPDALMSAPCKDPFYLRLADARVLA